MDITFTFGVRFNKSNVVHFFLNGRSKYFSKYSPTIALNSVRSYQFLRRSNTKITMEKFSLKTNSKRTDCISGCGTLYYRYLYSKVCLLNGLWNHAVWIYLP